MQPLAPNLLESIDVLWRTALTQYRLGQRLSIEVSLRCLYGGLTVVLPTVYELRFRLLLAKVLLQYTNNTAEAMDHLRKCLQLVLMRGEVPVMLKFVTVSLWFTAHQKCHPDKTGAVHDKSVIALLLDARALAIRLKSMNWWAHFDWICVGLGVIGPLRETLTLQPPHAVLLLAMLLKGKPIPTEGELTILMSSDSLICWLIALRHQIMMGNYEMAMELCRRISRQVDVLAGDHHLPGHLLLNRPQVIKVWRLLAAHLSLMIGEQPTPAVLDICPSLVRAYRQLDGLQKIDFGDFPQLDGLLTVQQLLVSADSTDALSRCQNPKSPLTPQLEAFRLILEAICLHRSHHAPHHTKNALLAALKILNSTTFNAQLKVMVLLLSGELYADTDFEMAYKMQVAAFSIADKAQWPQFKKLAAKGIVRNLKLLGRVQETTPYMPLINSE